MRLKYVVPTILLSACGHIPFTGGPSSPTEETGFSLALSNYAGRPVLVLPVQRVEFADSLGWVRAVPDLTAYMSSLDDEITFALKEKGLGAHWIFPQDIEAMVKKNPSLAANPRALRIDALTGEDLPRPSESVDNPLRSDLRELIALTDARYVLLPARLRIVGARGIGRADLRIALIDVRLGQIRWAGDIPSDPTTHFGPAIAASIASRIAGLTGVR